MTTENRELFELCKQVYEATGLADTIDYFYLKNNGDYNVQRANHIQVNHNWWKIDNKVPTGCFPLYTSDYLLEKLPEGTTILKDIQGYKAWNIYNRKRISTYVCDSPAEALLKLTIALSEAGELNDQSS